MAKSEQLLKIGFVLDGGLKEPDGVQQYILRLGEYFKSKGHQVRYIVAGEAVYGGTDAVSLSGTFGVRSNGNKLTVPLLPASRRKLRAYLRHEKFDVLHVQTPYNPVMGEQLIFLADSKTAIIGTFHIVPHYWILDVGDWILGHWCRLSLKRFDKMVSVSAAAQRIAKRDFGMDTEIVPNVIDYTHYNQARPFNEYEDSEALTILFLGRLVERKGCGQLIKAVSLLAGREGLPPFKIVICGKGPLEAKLKNFVLSRDLEDVVEFKGFVSEEDKPRFYASADISVFPASGGESFGIVLLEAMASGRATVLAGDNEGYRSVMGSKPELLFNPKDTAALADKLEDLILDANKRKALAAWGETYSKSFDVKKVGEDLLDIYRSALEKKRQSVDNVAMFKISKKDNTPEVAVTVSTETFVRLAIMTVLAIIIFFSVKRAEHALVLIFLAFFLSIALNAPVYWLSRKIPGKRKGSRSVATTLSFLIVVILLGAFLASIVPPLVRQTDNLVKAAPHLVSEFRNQNSPIGKFIRRHHLQKEVTTFSNQLSTKLGHFSGTAFSTAKDVGSSIFSMLAILVLTFMMLVEAPRWIAFAKDLIPDKHHSVAKRLSREMYDVVRGYVNGQVLLAALAALLIMPAVLLLHIGYPAGLVVVIFVCALIPMIGHTIGAVIVTLVALFHSTSAAIIILAYYLIYMQIEAYIIQPKIQANSTNMSPLLVFMSVVIGLSFGGILGGLVAIPLAGCLRIVVLEYLRTNKIIGDAKFDKVTSPETK